MLKRKVKREKEREGNSNVLYYYNYYRQTKARCDKAIFRHVRRHKLGKRIKKKKKEEKEEKREKKTARAKEKDGQRRAGRGARPPGGQKHPPRRAVPHRPHP